MIDLIRNTEVISIQNEKYKCKLYNNKYTIASIQMTSNEILAFIAVLVFKLLNRKVLFINKKDNRNCLKADYF